MVHFDTVSLASKVDLFEVKSELKAEIQAVRTELKSEMKVLRWMFGVMLAGIGALILKAFFNV